MSESGGLVGNTYELVGGPLDGQRVAIPPGAWEYYVYMQDRPSIDVLSGAASPWPWHLRLGRYLVQRHPRLGYALVWQGDPR